MKQASYQVKEGDIESAPSNGPKPKRKVKKILKKKITRNQLERILATSEDVSPSAVSEAQPQTIAPRDIREPLPMNADLPIVEVLDEPQDKAGWNEPPSRAGKDKAGFTYQFADPDTARPLIRKGPISGSINDSIQME